MFTLLVLTHVHIFKQRNNKIHRENKEETKYQYYQNNDICLVYIVTKNHYIEMKSLVVGKEGHERIVVVVVLYIRTKDLLSFAVYVR